MSVSRLFEMLYILLERDRVTAAELAQRLEVSVRTVYRDAQALCEAGIPLYANLNAQPYGENGAELLTKQICNPVRWQQTIENMIAAGVDTFVELGAGKTLSGLIRKTSANVRVFNVEKVEDIEKLREGIVHEG